MAARVAEAVIALGRDGSGVDFYKIRQNQGALFPLIQAEPWNVLLLGDLYCRRCYAENAGTDALVNVMAFADIAD